MSDRPSIFDPRFDDRQDRDGFSHRRSRIGRQAGCEKLGASLYEVEPGSTPFPYHWHAANEEMLIVLSGRPTLRTPEGSHEPEAGEVAVFPPARQGRTS